MRLFQFLVMVFLVALSSCESGIGFTEAQPAGVEKSELIPAQYSGVYVVSETRGKPVESPVMSLIIDDDSLIFREHRTAKLHKNFVDGASYTLQDNHLYRDGKKISLMPAELHGNTYTYVSRIDSMLLIFKEDLLVIEAEDTVFSVQAEIRTGTDYFVINVFSEFRHNVWVSYVFRELEGNKLEIRAAPAFSKLNEKTMRTTYHATIQEPSLYLMDPNNQAMFEKLMQNVFVSVLVLQKKQ